MDEIGKLTGRKYSLFDYYGDPEAKHVVVAMGSVTEALEETVDYLNARGEKTGLLKVRLYRPFVTEAFLKAMPESVERVAVLDRTKEPGSPGEPLFLDVRSAYQDQQNSPLIIGGRYGLGSKDTTPTHLNTVFQNLKSKEPKNNFTISIVDDVTHLSLPVEESIMTEDPETVRCKFWGLGSDGTVGANKAAIKIMATIPTCMCKVFSLMTPGRGVTIYCAGKTHSLHYLIVRRITSPATIRHMSINTIPERESKAAPCLNTIS